MECVGCRNRSRHSEYRAENEGGMIVYQSGDYIVKSTDGVCKVEDILHLNMSGVDC